MKSVLSVEEMREIELLTKKSLGVNDIDLMALAGKKLADDFILRVKPQPHDIISLVAGLGNNGGDGLVMALDLFKRNYKVKVILIGQMSHSSPTFKHYFDLIKQSQKVFFVSKDNENEIEKLLLSSTIIIDGIFGLGLDRPLSDHYLTLIKKINQYQKTVYAIDIPSGIHPMNGLKMPDAIQADYTGVIGYYKFGNLLRDALDYHGYICLLDIGLVKKHHTQAHLIEDSDFSIQPEKRKHHSHKYDYGLGYFIGGSKTMSGAINLSVLAAMRSGLGIANVFQENPQTRHLEVLYKDIMDNIDFTKVDSIVFGPGLLTGVKRYQSLYQEVNETEIKTVIDGGGLSYIDLNEVSNPNLVLTPHMKEFSDLVSASINDIENDLMSYIKRVTDQGVTLLLKGETTIIANKNHIYLYQAKNPGLASAGSGDVLTGMIASYFKGSDVFLACVKAVILHSQASKLARKQFGETSMMASDIINHIHHILKERV